MGSCDAEGTGDQRGDRTVCGYRPTALHAPSQKPCRHRGYFQTVFLKYALHTEPFADAEHEKAWLIRVTINACKDLLKSFFRSRTVSLDEVLEQPAALAPDHREVVEAVLSLPQKYRDVIYLHYYEGYSAPEIARILKKNVNTVYTLLGRAKQQLREALGGEGDA